MNAYWTVLPSESVMPIFETLSRDPDVNSNSMLATLLSLFLMNRNTDSSIALTARFCKLLRIPLKPADASRVLKPFMVPFSRGYSDTHKFVQNIDQHLLESITNSQKTVYSTKDLIL